MKTSADFMAEANAAMPRIPAAEAIAKHGSDAVFIDVRDSGTIAKSGTVAGAHRVPRGMLEFVADKNTQFYNAAFQPNAEIYLVCGAGGQAALAGKTLTEMGYSNVTNIGGFGDWKDAGGPVED